MGRLFPVEGGTGFRGRYARGSLSLTLVPRGRVPGCKEGCNQHPDAHNPSHGWQSLPHHLTKDQLWNTIREEAKLDAVRGTRGAGCSADEGGKGWTTGVQVAGR